MPLEIRVNHEPVAQPRQRHRAVIPAMEPEGIANAHEFQQFMSKVRRTSRTQNYVPKEHPVHAFKVAVVAAAMETYGKAPLTGPFRVRLTLVFPRPRVKRWKTKPMPRYRHTGRPDVDNVYKAVADCLEGVLWHNDSHICSVAIEKWVAAGDEEPHVVIEVSRLKELV